MALKRPSMKDGAKTIRELVIKCAVTPWASKGHRLAARFALALTCFALPALLLTLFTSLAAEDFENAHPLVAMVVAFSIGIPFSVLVSACVLCSLSQRRRWVNEFYDVEENRLKADQEERMIMMRAALSPEPPPAQPEEPSASPPQVREPAPQAAPEPKAKAKAAREPKAKAKTKVKAKAKPTANANSISAQTVPSALSLNFTIKNLNHGKLSVEQLEILKVVVSQRLTEPLNFETSSAYVVLTHATDEDKEPVVKVSGRIALPPYQEGEDRAELMRRAQVLKAKLTGNNGLHVCEAIQNEVNAIEEIHRAKINRLNGVTVNPIFAAILAKSMEKENPSKKAGSDDGGDSSVGQSSVLEAPPPPQAQEAPRSKWAVWKQAPRDQAAVAVPEGFWRPGDHDQEDEIQDDQQQKDQSHEPLVFSLDNLAAEDDLEGEPSQLWGGRGSGDSAY